ncbi:MAG: lipase maturation factor family protein [Candidatus Latescibacteria bacterium]|nr:lipase maturation factor family protein [Candidatus Latescibacterota bacterium]
MALKDKFLDLWCGAVEPGLSPYWLTRALLLRGLGLIYTLAFLILTQQFIPLVGEGGILPVNLFLEQVAQEYGPGLPSWLKLPTLMWLDCSDTFMLGLVWLGLGLSLLLLCGVANVPLLLSLWAIYLSCCHVGQLFYSFGWEILLLETGFLAVFLCPLWRTQVPPAKALVWLFRWVLFRLMLGAGLIKLRGDPCWWDLSCLIFHYQTQPLPNPLSWYFHQLPVWFHQGSVLFNHLAELVVPWFFFGPRRLRHAAGLLTIVFQISLILSGNLSWLNYLSIVLCVACFDDAALALFLLPIQGRARSWMPAPCQIKEEGRLRRALLNGLVILILYLSIGPVLNLLSPRQAMNASFDPLHLVNTYGAFGSVGQHRPEIILEGTVDSVITDSTRWLPYEFRGKPGDPQRRPPLVSPYHYKLDWQLWFAAMSDYRRQPWLVHYVYLLLTGDQGALSLLGNNPFAAQPPHFIRAELYEYRFAPPGQPGWWEREYLGPYLPPLAANDPALLTALAQFGWISAPPSPGP